MHNDRRPKRDTLEISVRVNLEMSGEARQTLKHLALEITSKKKWKQKL